MRVKVLKNIYKALNGVFFLEGIGAAFCDAAWPVWLVFFFIFTYASAQPAEIIFIRRAAPTPHTASQLSLLVYFIILLPLLLLRLLLWAGTKHACKARAVRFFLAPGKWITYPFNTGGRAPAWVLYHYFCVMLWESFRIMCGARISHLGTVEFFAN